MLVWIICEFELTRFYCISTNLICGSVPQGLYFLLESITRISKLRLTYKCIAIITHICGLFNAVSLCRPWCKSYRGATYVLTFFWKRPFMVGCNLKNGKCDMCLSGTFPLLRVLRSNPAFIVQRSWTPQTKIVVPRTRQRWESPV